MITTTMMITIMMDDNGNDGNGYVHIQYKDISNDENYAVYIIDKNYKDD
jgi:hypothetical protein